MSRRIVCRWFAVLLLLLGSTSNGNAADAPLTDAQKLAQVLSSTVEFDFDEMPLQDVVKSLHDKLQIKTHLDRKALGDANVQLDTPITFKIKGVSCRSTLRLLLRDLDLKFAPRDGVLWITTKDVADEMYESRVYAVRDLVANRDDPTNTAIYDFNSLINVIQNTVQPDAWDVPGRAPTAKFAAAGAIAVSAADETHEQIADLIDMLRRARDQQFSEGKPKPLAQRNLSPVLSRGAAAPKIRKALAQTMDFSFDQKPLDEIVALLAKKCDIPFGSIGMP